MTCYLSIRVTTITASVSVLLTCLCSLCLLYLAKESSWFKFLGSNAIKE